MFKKLITTAVLVVAFVSFSFAQDVTGHWTGKVMDQFDIAYDFKVDGEKLTGTNTGPDGKSTPVSDGVIKGSDLSFTIDIMGNATKITGKIKGDIITLSFKVMDNDTSVDLKKTK